MRISFNLGPEYKRTLANLDEDAKALIPATHDGLAKGVTFAAVHVSENFLSGQYLKRRTSNLANSVQGWMHGDLEGVVGVAEGAAVDHYKYLLGDETKVIRPQNAKYLAIPIGEALTGSGVVKGKYAQGPGKIWDSEKLFIITSKGQPIVGYKRGKKGKFRPLYVLKKEVTVYGTGALYDGVEESVPQITESINEEIRKKLN